jgi:hypothetical protein
LLFDLEPHDQCKFIGMFAEGNYSAKTSGVETVPDSGSCAPSGGTPDIEPAEFGQFVRVCEGAELGDTCGSDGTCAPAPITPFEPGLCVYREGERECPSDDYPSRTILYAGLDDQRDCSACTCDSPTGATCEAQVELHYNDSCSNLGGLIDPAGVECEDLSDANSGYAPRSAKMIVTDVVGGGCDPGGGEPSGEAVLTGAVTLCCSE